MKKYLTLLLSFILIFSLSISTYAADSKYYVNGNWQFHESPLAPSFSSYEISFASNSSFFSSFVYDGMFLYFDDVLAYDYDMVDWRKSEFTYIDFGANPVEVSEAFYSWIRLCAVPLVEQIVPESPDDSDTTDSPTIETIIIKEDRPFFTTPIDEYTVTEGLLLLLFVITFLNNIFKQHLKGN